MNKVTRLHELLAQLRAGNSVETNPEDRYSDMSLYFVDGRWERQYQNCFSATCNCASHPRWVTEQVGRGFVLAELKALIEREQQDAKIRASETAWLDEAIAASRV